jgi:hypothetical protein
MKKEKSLKQLKKLADKYCSDYIRQRDGGSCFTCGNWKEWRYQQNGHYVPRNYLSTRFLERNCHCQCVSCNVFKKGNMDAYALMLVRKYGPGILEELNRIKHEECKLTKEDYKNLIESFKNKINNLT